MKKDFIEQVWQGKTIYRILMNRELEKASRQFSGKALDLASGESASYKKYLPSNLEFVSADIKLKNKGEGFVDFNEPLPFETDSFDYIYFINALYIVKNRALLLREIKRVLRPNGKLVVVSPFIANEMPEPDDFCRLTYQGLLEELEEAGLKVNELKRFGERFSSAVYLLDPFWYFRVVKLMVYPIALGLDCFLTIKIKRRHPSPLGYIAISSK